MELARKGQPPELLQADNLVEQMKRKGAEILHKDPHFLDTHSHLGHYNIGTVDYQASSGATLVTDLKEGKQLYYDATSHWMTSIINPERHPELTDPSLLSYLGKLSLETPTPSEMTTVEQAAFTQMMLDFWPEANFVFPTTAGTLAVNDACSVAADLVRAREGLAPQDMKGVAFEFAFHGRAGWGAEATHPTPKVAYRQTNRIIRCPAPTVVLDNFGNINKERTQFNLENTIYTVDQALRNAAVAFVIIEYPFQAEGGAQLQATRILEELNNICHQYGKILIVDCIQMGGRSWSQLQENDLPRTSPFPNEALKYADIITFGKIFKVSGFMARDPLFLSRGFSKDNNPMRDPYKLGATWTGRLSDMVAGYAIMQAILQKKLWEKGLKLTRLTLERLREMVLQYPNTLIKPRGKLDTAYLGWDFENIEMRNYFKDEMSKQGFLVLPAGEKAIRWAPALDATDEEITDFLQAVEQSLLTIKKK
jgi:L-lysine 6-transaminase